jgi:Dockerin type I domain
VNVMPSIKATPNPVTAGQALTVTGYSIPDAVVTLENQLDKSSITLKSFTANSDANGFWSITLDTTGFKNGTYKLRAKARQTSGDLIETNYSNYTFYGVGQAAEAPRSSDLNRDGKVNLIDFSILLFWWNSDGGNSNPPADINGDGKVSLTDFSIMIFNWTG